MKSRTKAYLGRIRLGRERIGALKAIERELSRNIDGLRCVNSARDTVGNPAEAAARDLLSKIDDVEVEILRYSAEIEAAEEQILNMRDLTHQAVLFGIYAEGRCFKDVGEKIGYSSRHVSRLHGAALSAFMDQYGEVVTSALSIV